MSVKWYFIVVLVCIFLMISDVEHVFMCLLVIYISPLEKCLCKSLANFWIRFFNCWVVGVLYIFWIAILYQIHDLQIFFPFHGLPFHDVDTALWCKKVSTWSPICLFFLLLSVLLVSSMFILVRNLSIFLIFSKNQILVLLIFSIVCFLFLWFLL